MRQRALVLIAIFSLISGLCNAQELQKMQPEDLLREVSVGTPEVSPDGHWVAYRVSSYCMESEKRVGDIYVIPFAGGKPLRLTSHAGVEGDYAWSPDSRQLAFSAKRGDSKKSQIYVIDISRGEARRLTDIESGASDPLWSPDGKSIAFSSSVGDLYNEEEKEAFGDVRYVKHPRYFHLGRGWDTGKRRRIFVVSVDDGGEAKQLSDGPCADEGDHSFVWSPDSTTIAYVSNRSSEWWNSIDTNIYTVDVESEEIRQVTSNPGPDHSPVFSPDGKWLAYRASYEYNYESEAYKIHVVPSGGGQPTVLSDRLDRNVRSIAWGPQSRRIYFTASDQGRRNLQYVELDQPNSFVKVTDGWEQVSSFRVVDNQRFVIHASTDVTPREVYTLVQGKLTQLTREASQPWQEFAISPSQEIWVRGDDHPPLQGWLILPTDHQPGSPCPLILSIHGGPHGMYSPSFRSSYQLLANHGYAVLYTNPRGSDGYGQAFTDSIHEDWHTAPFADLMRFVDHLVDTGVADPERLGVTGGSYGGYMTNWVIGHTDRFAAAISSAGLSNMVSFFGTTDEQFFAEKEMAGVPWRNRETYLDNSPLWAADSVSTPTMFIHGDNDWRVRPEQGEQLFVALQKVGVPSVYVNFPDEQHGIRQPKHQLLRYQLMMEWFDHWLLDKPVKLATYIKPRAYVHPPTPPEDQAE
jgi:dipeptidyl aminopeptidase/acylaminoacyl peptidase